MKVTLYYEHSRLYAHWFAQQLIYLPPLGSFLSDRDRDPAELPSDDSKIDADGTSAKRRHSRPHALDSEGEEEEADTSGKEEESLSDREEEPDEIEVTDRLSGKVSPF